ncbi:response regulator transcription factor, partial [Dactylosporangium sp. NPDC006015]|uniref:response regulator transcription factor n=1 Tax=Dactylosporangium sp. NPDC006015 TaxID=3154576 RepID=UPI0033BF06A9
ARLAAATPDPPVPAGGALTAREVEILRLVATGATNREIARALFVSEGTVKNHVSRVLTRLGLRDRTQAALYAREHGLLAE